MATNLETGRLAWISDEIRDFERSHALQEIENQTQVERGYRLFFTIMKSVPGISTEPYWERGVEMIELPELFSKTRKAEIHWIEKLVGHTGNAQVGISIEDDPTDKHKNFTHRKAAIVLKGRRSLQIELGYDSYTTFHGNARSREIIEQRHIIFDPHETVTIKNGSYSTETPVDPRNISENNWLRLCLLLAAEYTQEKVKQVS